MYKIQQVLIVSATFSTLCQGVEMLHFTETRGNYTPILCRFYWHQTNLCI